MADLSVSLKAAATSGLESGLRKSVDKAVPGIIDTVLDQLWSHPWYGFIAGGQCALIQAGMKPKEAWEPSRATLLEHVRSENLTFGDPAFDWGPNGGRDVVQECEIDHWESAA